ncbi:MAG: D-alanine--D-alanine ligase [Spirochaetota bacterium]|nr:D-alanine--D-alanine ligase [Spirochaetota bacterium]
MHLNKVLVLAGGSSVEKEISKQSGINLYQALSEAGFDTTIIDPTQDDFSFDFLKKYDVIYPILHGNKGEDGCIQGVLETLNIPYVGCDVLSSAITMNKSITKKIFQSLDIPCAKGFTTTSNIQDNLTKIEAINYPVFIKPVSEGSSIGSLILHNKEEAQDLLPKHLQQFPNSLVEELLIGREMTVGIIKQNNQIQILPILELKPKAEFYNFETKYTAGMTDFVMPAPMDQETLNLIHFHVTTIFKEFNLRDCIRVDLMLTDKGPIYLEINTAPGMTQTSDIPLMLTAADINIKDFVTQMIKNAQERNFS